MSEKLNQLKGLYQILKETKQADTIERQYNLLLGELVIELLEQLTTSTDKKVKK